MELAQYFHVAPIVQDELLASSMASALPGMSW
jgi:hypothetical protein